MTLVLSDLGPIPYDGQPHAASVTVTGEVAGFPAAVDVSYDGNAAAPVEVGSHDVLASLAASETDYTAAAASGELVITVGAPSSITINGAGSFSGTAGQPLAGALPSVKVTDVGGHPVAGVAVTFAASAGNGTLTGAAQNTDQNGIATLGGWTLSPVPGNNNASASAAGVSGSVAFVASGAADATPLTVSIDDGRSATQVGRSLTWTIEVGNPRSSAAAAVHVVAGLPPEVDAGSAQWQCIPTGDASCTASGSGGLDDSIDLPAGSGVTYLLTAVVTTDLDGMITTTVSVDDGNSTITRSDDTEIVIFRDSFEAGGDGAQTRDDLAKLAEVDALVDGGALEIALDPARVVTSQVVTIARAVDRSFAVEAIRIGTQLLVRVVAGGASGDAATAWSALEGKRFALLREGAQVALVGAERDLRVQVPADAGYTIKGVSQP